MLYILIITGLVLVLLGAALTIAYLLRQQRDAAMQDVTTIAQRLKDIEMMLEREPRASREEDEETPSTPQEDLSAMSNEELFQYLTTFIREHKLYLWSDLNRAAVMQHFSLSAARVGAAVALPPRACLWPDGGTSYDVVCRGGLCLRLPAHHHVLPRLQGPLRHGAGGI